MARIKWIQWVAIAGTIVLLTSGCSLFKSNGQSQPIDPPPQGANVVTTVNVQPAGSGSTAQEDQTKVTLYYQDSNGFVSPLSLTIPPVVGVAKEALSYMVDDGPSESMLPMGFTPLLPAGTQILGLNITPDKLAIVDFSKEFTDYNPQDERKILEAITWTLTGFPTVDKVEIWVQGEPLKEMPVGATPLDEPLSRAMGINIESPQGIDYGQATPVTLYFMEQTDDQYPYLVPVTRMVKRTDDAAQATMQELIKGPSSKQKLIGLLPQGTEVLHLEQSADLITIDFNSSILDADHKAPSEALESVILSLTENTGAARVQIMVEGDAAVIGSDNQNYNLPVSRPVHVNPLML